MNREPFLEAIREKPDDPTPRLVYADWLMERGDPLGELIRIEIQFDAENFESEESRQAVLKQWHDLWDQHGQEWFGPLIEMGVHPTSKGFFHPSDQYFTNCGFVESAVIRKPDLFPEHADELFGLAPLLSEIYFERKDIYNEIYYDRLDLAGVLNTPQLQRIRKLSLSQNELSANDLNLIAVCPNLKAIEGLELNFNDFGPACGEILGKSQLLNQLSALEIRGCDIESIGLRLLTQHQQGKMREISLAINALDYRARKLIIDGFPKLEKLDVSNNDRIFEISRLSRRNRLVTGLEDFRDAPFIRKLIELYLDECNVGDEGVRVLGELNLVSLDWLDISENQITDISPIVNSSHLEKLKTLYVARNFIGLEGARGLAKLAKQLEMLDVNQQDLTPEGVELISNVFSNEVIDITSDIHDFDWDY